VHGSSSDMNSHAIETSWRRTVERANISLHVA